MRRITKIAIGTVAIAAVAMTAACSSPAPGPTSPDASTPAAEVDTSLVIGIQAAPANGWNPALWTWDSYIQVAQASYDTLLRPTDDQSFTPGLATEWDWVSPTEFHMVLREGVTFTDGSDFNADVVKSNIEYAQAAGGRYAPLIASISAVNVEGDHEVSIEMTTPLPNLEVLFSQNLGMMISPLALENPDMLAEGPQGSGPYEYVAAESVADDTFVFTKNEDYWDAENIHFDDLTFRLFSQNPQTAFAAVRSGEVDMVYGDALNVDEARNSDLIITEGLGSILGLTLVGAGTDLAPELSDVRVRQAMNYAVNRDAIAENLVPGIPTSEMFSADSEAFNPSVQDYYEYDPKQAKELLADAGYPDGFDLGVLLLPRDEQLLQAVGADLAAVGINVQMASKPGPEFVKSAVAREYPANFAPLTPTTAFVDIQEYFLPTGSKAPRIVNEDMVDLFEESLVMNEADRRKAFQEIAKISVETAFTLPIMQYTSYYYHNGSKVEGLTWPSSHMWPAIYDLKPPSN